MDREMCKRNFKLARIFPIVIGGIGILMYWAGMFYALHNLDIVHLEGLIAAYGGMLLIAAAYPIREFLMAIAQQSKSERT